jgi:hypothetical protein
VFAYTFMLPCSMLVPFNFLEQKKKTRLATFFRPNRQACERQLRSNREAFATQVWRVRVLSASARNPGEREGAVRVCLRYTHTRPRAMFFFSPKFRSFSQLRACKTAGKEGRSARRHLARGFPPPLTTSHSRVLEHTLRLTQIFASTVLQSSAPLFFPAG